MLLPGSSDERAKHHRGRPGVVEGGVRGRDVQRQLLDKSRKAGGLAFGKVQNHPRQG